MPSVHVSCAARGTREALEVTLPAVSVADLKQQLARRVKLQPHHGELGRRFSIGKCNGSSMGFPYGSIGNTGGYSKVLVGELSEKHSTGGNDCAIEVPSCNESVDMWDAVLGLHKPNDVMQTLAVLDFGCFLLSHGAAV